MIASFIVAARTTAQVERARIEYKPLVFVCQISTVAFAIGRQSPNDVTMPLIDSGSPGSSIAHSRLRHGTSRRYSGPAVTSAVG
jgi:hypothetical protein